MCRHCVEAMIASARETWRGRGVFFLHIASVMDRIDPKGATKVFPMSGDSGWSKKWAPAVSVAERIARGEAIE